MDSHKTILCLKFDFVENIFLQRNLAVGGNWPGTPDETTDFDNAELKVDYIKVYQLDSYDENVKKPDSEKVILRDPDESGNYIANGDFSKEDNKNWEFMTALNGIGSSEIKDNKMTVKTENAGTADYSIQLVQPKVPLKEGGKYRVSFGAKAADARTMIVDVSVKRTKFALNQNTQYVLYFDAYSEQNKNMKEATDANAVFSISMGAVNGTQISDKHTITIDNVKLEEDNK